MKGKDYFVFFLTFITGIFAGAYLYITSFVPDYQQDNISEISEVDFLLQGQERGDCGDIYGLCASFELQQDRTYKYMTRSTPDIADAPLTEGRLNKKVFIDFVDYLRTVELTELAQVDFNTCPSRQDVTYTYSLVFTGESYQFSTCDRVFATSNLSQELNSLWHTVTSVSTSTSNFDNGISGFLEQQLDKRFHYDD